MVDKKYNKLYHSQSIYYTFDGNVKLRISMIQEVVS